MRARFLVLLLVLVDFVAVLPVEGGQLQGSAAATDEANATLITQDISAEGPAVLTRDGRFVVSAGQGPPVLWEAGTGRMVRKYASPRVRTLSVSLSPDELKLVALVADEDSESEVVSSAVDAVVWELATGTEILRVPEAGAGFVHLFTKDSKGWIYSRGDGLTIVDLGSGRDLSTLEEPGVSALGWHASFLVVGQADGGLTFFHGSWKDGFEYAFNLSTQGAPVDSFVSLEKQGLLLSEHQDRGWRVWEVRDTIGMMLDLREPGRLSPRFKLSADGREVVWNDGPSRLVRYDVATGQSAQVGSVDDEIVDFALASRTGAVAAVTSNGALRLLAHDTVDSRPLPLRDHATAVGLTGDGRQAAVGTSEGTAILFDIGQGRELLRLDLAEAAGIPSFRVEQIAVSPDERWIAAALGPYVFLISVENASIARWLTAQESQEEQEQEQENLVRPSAHLAARRIGFSSDSASVVWQSSENIYSATTSGEGFARVDDRPILTRNDNTPESRRLALRFAEAGINASYASAISPDGTCIVGWRTGLSNDGKLTIDSADPQMVSEVDTGLETTHLLNRVSASLAPEAFLDVEPSKGCALLVVRNGNSNGGTAQIWDLTRHRLVAQSHDSWPTPRWIEPALDQHSLVEVREDGWVVLRSTGDGSVQASFDVGRSVAHSRVLPDGNRVVVGFPDGTAEIRQLPDGTVVRELGSKDRRTIARYYDSRAGRVLLGDGRSRLEVWDQAVTGQTIHFEATSPVRDAALSETGESIYVATAQGFEVFATSTGELRRSIEVAGTQEVGATGMALSADSPPEDEQADRAFQLWDLETGEKIQALSLRQAYLTAAGRAVVVSGVRHDAATIRTLRGRPLKSVADCLVYAVDKDVCLKVREGRLEVVEANREPHLLDVFANGMEGVPRLSPDGSLVLVPDSLDYLKVYEASTGTLLAEIREGDSSWAHRLIDFGLSADGETGYALFRQVDEELGGPDLLVFAPRTGEILNRIRSDSTRAAVLGAGYNVIAIATDQDTTFYDASDGGVLLRTGLRGDPSLVAFGADDLALLVDSAVVVLPRQGREIALDRKSADPPRRVAFSADGRRFFANERIWSMEEGIPLLTASGADTAISMADPASLLRAEKVKSDCGGIWGDDCEVSAHFEVIDLDAFNRTTAAEADLKLRNSVGWELGHHGTMLLALESYGGVLTDLPGFQEWTRLDNSFFGHPASDQSISGAISDDGINVALGSAAGVTVFSARHGKRLFGITLKGEPTDPKKEERVEGSERVVSMSFAPEGRTLLAGGESGTVGLLSIPDRRLVWSLDTGRARLQVAFSSDGKRWILSSRDLPAEVRSTADGTPVVRLAGESRGEGRFQFSPDGRWVLGVTVDQQTRLWRSDGEEVCRIVSMKGGGWVVVAPDGRFDTNSLEGLGGVYWRVSDDPMKVFPLEVFMQQYFEPGLLAKLLRGEALPTLPAIAGIDRRQPTVAIDAVSIDTERGTATVRVLASAADASSQVCNVRLFRNDKLVAYLPEDGGCLASGPSSAVIEFNGIRMPGRDEDVELAAYAFNGSSVKSETVRRVVKWKPAVKSGARAFVLSVGVDRYRTPELNLSFAAADARALNESLQESLRATGRYSRVGGEVLVSDDAAQEATKGRFALAIQRLAASSSLFAAGGEEALLGPDDLVIITVSSHGVTDQTGEFHLLLADTGEGAEGGVTSQELSDWLRELDVGSILLVLDTCHSGAAVGPSFKPGPMADRGLGQLAYDKGIRILAASQNAGYALESAAVRHGLLSWTLAFEALEGRWSDRAPRDGQVSTAEWLRWGSYRVPGLARSVRAGKLVDVAGQSVRGVVEVIDAASGDLQTPRLFDFNRRDDSSIVACGTAGCPFP